MQPSPSELRYRDFFEDVPVGLFALAPDGRILDANPAMVSMLRYPSREALLETNAADFQLDPADAVRIAEKLRDGGEITDLNVQLVLPDGSTAWLLTNARAARDESGGVLYYQGTIQDITDHHRAELEERRIARRFRDLFESSPEAVFVQSVDGVILDANHEACALCGRSHDDLVGSKIDGIIPPENLAKLTSWLPNLVRGEVIRSEIVIRSAEGRVTPVALSCGRIEFAGRPALLLHARDIGDQKRLQEQFLQSQKMEAIGRMAGGIAHDFNNLLTAIIGYNELVLSGLNVQDPLWRSSEEVRKTAERAARLTRQLLAFSRKQTLEPRIVDLNACVSEIEKMLHRLLGDDIELSVIPSPKAACVRADPSQLEQVIINIAVNARDAMPSGGQLFVRISNVALAANSEAAPDLPAGDYVVLRITDTGSGMTEEVRARIFEPFFTTKEPGKGTGLGLATSYGIVKQSGGRILCNTSPHRGTTFSIYLPQVIGKPEPISIESLGPLPRGTETILVVEDAAAVRGLIVRVLHSLGYRLLEAENGFDALTIIDRCGVRSIDLVLTDVTMPKMGGRELIERIRAEQPRMRVLFTSGTPGADLDLKPHFEQPGAAFLHKPFTPADLARLVRTVLSQPLDPPHLHGAVTSAARAA